MGGARDCHNHQSIEHFPLKTICADSETETIELCEIIMQVGIPDSCVSAPYLQHLKIWTLNSKNKRVRAISRHLISFLKNIFDLHWFFEQMTFSKENKKQKQFPLKINENVVFKNQKTVSIENPTKCQGWIFFRLFLIFRKSL